MSDPFNPSGTNTLEQTMLLRVIDARFETVTTKVDGVANSVKALGDAVAALSARYDRRFEDHEARIAKIEAVMVARTAQVADFDRMQDRVDELETWQTDTVATARTTSTGLKILWGAIGTHALAFVGFLISGYLNAPATPTVQHPPGYEAPGTGGPINKP